MGLEVISNKEYLDGGIVYHGFSSNNINRVVDPDIAAFGVFSEFPENLAFSKEEYTIVLLDAIRCLSRNIQ